uniref:DUF3089 domain-containing protein n=1 Tax=Altererythrobacter segetis TaxID=1104773 RepID=UPI00140BC4F7|nr:DUF3089 domain-containing protein [Altererythrobacter segetis]
MARKFLYFIVVCVLLVFAALLAMRLWPAALSRLAFAPTGHFQAQAPLAGNAYQDPGMWFARPGLGSDPTRWQPPGTQGAAAPPPGDVPPFAVFFVHPTSYLERSHWNAPLDDKPSQDRARLFLKGLASPFGQASEIWAPRYRQAAVGAFLTHSPEAREALDLAYQDVSQAFDEFLAHIGPDTPVVLAGHSQGALLVDELLRKRIAGTPLQGRIALAYPIGWPISAEHDLPALGLPACATPEQAGCLVTWSSFAEPADPGMLLEWYQHSAGYDGRPRGGRGVLCVNPLTGTIGGAAPASANLGTLVPSADLSSGELLPGAVAARCGKRGLLLIANPPELGPYVLPGNNYHVYDIPLFWENLRLDVARRMRTWSTQHR